MCSSDLALLPRDLLGHLPLPDQLIARVPLVELARQALLLALTVSLPVVAAGLAAGALAGFVSAALRLHDGSLALLPRHLAVGAVIAAFGATGLGAVVRFTDVVWRAIPTLVP